MYRFVVDTMERGNNLSLGEPHRLLPDHFQHPIGKENSPFLVNARFCSNIRVKYGFAVGFLAVQQKEHFVIT